MSKIFQINGKDIVSAMVSGLLMGLLVVLVEIVQTGSIWGLEWKTLLNLGILAVITSMISFLKSLLTTDSGNFLGKVKIK